MAISADGVEGWEMYEKGGMSGERMREFLDKILKSKKGYLVVMDNATTHGTRDVRNIISDTGNKLLHTVPYSPELNAIEEFFNQFKYHIRRVKPADLGELKSAIEGSLGEIKKRGCCKNFFIHAYNHEQIRVRKHRLRPPKKYKHDD